MIISLFVHLNWIGFLSAIRSSYEVKSVHLTHCSSRFVAIHTRPYNYSQWFFLFPSFFFTSFTWVMNEHKVYCFISGTKGFLWFCMVFFCFLLLLLSNTFDFNSTQQFTFSLSHSPLHLGDRMLYDVKSSYWIRITWYEIIRIWY